MQITPVVSVIIPVYQGWSDLVNCLDALEHQTYASDRYEIIVVDNECNGVYPDEIRTFPHVRVVQEPKPGSYAARNKGVEEARGEILAFTDADCLPRSGWIEEAVKVFRGNSDIRRVTGEIELTFEYPNRRHAVELYEQVFAFQQRRKVEEEGTAVTANLFVRRDVFSSVGSFNESLKSGGDLEWGRRATALGFSIAFAPQVCVQHPARRTWLSIVSKTVRLYGGYWELSGRGAESKVRNLLRAITILLSSYQRIAVACVTPRLQTWMQRLKVVAVILLLQLALVYEHYRLLLGGHPKRL